MKTYKLFTESLDTPQQGDYVICHFKLADNQREYELNKKIKDQIGKIQYVDKGKEFRYIVRFDRKIIETTSNNPLLFKENEIVAFAKTKEELLLRLQAQKYNL